MEYRNRRRIWAWLSALWLVAACLAGCRLPVTGGMGTVEQAKDGGRQWEETRYSDGTSRLAAELESGQSAGDESPVQLSEVSPAVLEMEETDIAQTTDQADLLTVEESGVYTSKEEVALYIHLYGHLPDNYITKREAEAVGWDSRAGNLWEVAPGMSIGGSRFGNYEGALPDKEGRKYYECDIDYEGGYRGAKRMIYSDDGLIFYTEDHYESFEELYGE